MKQIDGLFLPRITGQSHLSAAAQIRCCESIGMIFANALKGVDAILIGQHFHPSLYQMIHSLTLEECDLIRTTPDHRIEIPTSTYKKLLKSYLKSAHANAFHAPLLENHSMIEQQQYYQNLNTAVEDFVESGRIPALMSQADPQITRRQFLEDHHIHSILSATCVIAKSMREHIQQGQIGDWAMDKGHSPTIFINKIEGVVTKEKVKAALRGNDPLQGWMEKWIDDASDQDLKKLLWATSGTSTLLQEGGLRLDITNGEVASLPAFHTCTNTIDLPQYTSYRQFKRKLDQALEALLQEAGAFQFV